MKVEKNLHKLFQEAEYCPKSRLSDNIFNVIEHKNTQITKLKRFGYLGVSTLSLSGSVFSIKSLIEQSSRLGFYDYLSLAFSDGGTIAMYWKEYVFSLADSLPIASLVISCLLLFVLFISIQRASYQFKARLLA